MQIVSHKGLVSGRYMFLNSNTMTIKGTTLFLKICKEFEVFQRKYTNGQWALKRYSILLVIREIQIETTMRYCFFPTVKAEIKM